MLQNLELKTKCSFLEGNLWGLLIRMSATAIDTEAKNTGREERL